MNTSATNSSASDTPGSMTSLVSLRRLTTAIVVFATVLLGLASSGFAQGISNFGAVAPTPGPNDQSLLTSTANSGNYVDNQRPGQSFTVGANALGYVLTDLYLQEATGTAGGGQPQPTTYNVRVYSVSGTTATMLTQYVMTNQLTIVQGNWIRITGLTNVLAANGVYGFSINRNGGGGWWTVRVDATQPYAGGTHGNFPAGSGTISTATSDMAFVASLTAITDPLVGATTISTANPVYAGTAVTLSATFGGTAPFTSFVWQQDGGTGFTNLPSSTTNTYSLDTTSMTLGTYQYRLVVTGGAGTITNTAASMTLLAASGPIVVANTTLTPSLVPVGGTTVVSATYAGTLPITYQWLFNGVNIPGATANVLTLTNVQFANAGSYSLVASNNPGGVPTLLTNTPATLAVRYPVVLSDFGTTDPVTNAYDIAQFDTTGNVGNPGVGYYTDNTPGQTFTTGSDPNGYSLSSLYIKYRTIADGAHVAGNPWTLRLYSLTNSALGNAVLIGTYTNENSAPAINTARWLKWHGPITNILSPNSSYAYMVQARGATTGGAGFLQVGNASNTPSFYSGGRLVSIPAAGGAMGLGNAGTANFDATFMVNLVPAGYPSVQDISSTPTNGSTIFAGAPVTLNVTAIGTNIGYIWQTDNGTGGASFSDLSSSNTNSYNLNTSGLLTGNTYQFRVVVTNSLSSVTSSVVSFSVLAAVIQSVSISPVNTPVDPVYAGTPVTLSSTVQGNNLYYIWRENSVEIHPSNTNQYTFSTSAMTPGTYTYDLLVTNSSGSVLSAQQVTLNLVAASGPVLLTGATATPSVVIVGNNAQLNATFTGSQPITYQWKHAGTNLPGATSNSLTITAAQIADAGAYVLQAANNPPGIGPVTSNSATANLYVVAAPQDNTVSAKVSDGGASPIVGAFDVSQLAEDAATAPPDINYYADANPPAGQTFTTGNTPPTPAGYPLNYVYLKHENNGNGTGYSTVQPYTLRIYEMRDANSAQPLTTYVTTNAASFSAGNWIRISGLTNVLKTNTTYAFTLNRNTSGWWKLAAHVSIPDDYAGGDAVRVPLLGGAVTHGSPDTNGFYYDAAFVAGMTPASAPTELAAMTINPSSINTGQGPVVMTASFEGSLPITYQWQHEGTNIPGATATTYTIPVASVARQGTYVCLASNEFSLGTPTPSTSQFLTVDPSVQTGLINPTTRNGSFELVSGIHGGAAKVNISGGAVDNWKTWTAFPNSGDTGADDGVESTDGTRYAFLQGDSGVYNIAGHIITAGDKFIYSWDWVLAGRGSAIAQLGYWNGSSVVLIPGTESIAPGGGGILLGLGTNYTVLSGNPAIGNPVVLTVHAPNGSNYPEVDNFVLTLIPAGSVATNPTNITTVVNGNQMTLSWPADHTGWRLQTQTNAPGVGLTGTWVNVVGSDLTNQVTIPVNPANGSVFFRMIYP